LQSTFVLIGDIAIASFSLLLPFLHSIFREMIQILHNRDYMIPISVYNNVLWALGEIVMRWEPSQVQPYIPSLIEVLIPLLTHPLVPESIHENSFVTLGRIGLSCPLGMAPYLKSFLHPWLQKSFSVGEGEEKETALRGLCAIIKFNARDAHDVSIV
jgi:transportin-1